MHNDDINIDLDDEILDLEKIAVRQKKALRAILDSYISGSKILVNRMHMGKTLESMQKSIPSYIGSLTLRKVAEIKMGNEMPFMKEKIDCIVFITSNNIN